jgi:hypothetical protein
MEGKLTMNGDERYATAVFRSLDGEPGPSTVDILRAVADGERHHRRVRLVGSTGVAVAVAAILTAGWTVANPDRRENTAPSTESTATQAPPTKSPEKALIACTVEQLATPSGQGPKAVVSGADPTGRYIVGRTYPGKPTTVIWVDRQPHLAAMPGDDPVLRDITSSGVAVGSSFIGDKIAAWVYVDGKYTRLSGSGETEANAINEQRMIAGAVRNKPAVWRSPTAQPTMLALPGSGWSGAAFGIDEDGTVVGSMSQKDGARVAAVWRPDGTVTQLAAPTAHGGPANDYVADSIRNGWVSGWAAFDRDRIRYIGGPRWNLNTGAVHNSDGLFEAVNKQGWMVGGSVLVTDDQTVQLPVPRGFETAPEVHAYTLSDDGTTIAGQVSTRGGSVEQQPIAVVWTCKRSG